jgi:hypothetical protein
VHIGQNAGRATSPGIAHRCSWNLGDLHPRHCTLP